MHWEKERFRLFVAHSTNHLGEAAQEIEQAAFAWGDDADALKLHKAAVALHKRFFNYWRKRVAKEIERERKAAEKAAKRNASR